MKVSALIRKTAKKNDTDTLATVYFRLRDGKKDIKAASELTINPNHWSAEKQGFKDRVALVSEKEKQAFNSHVRNIVTLITQSYTNEANGEWLSETIERYHHPQRFQTEDALAEAIKLQVIPLFDEFLEKHKLSEVRKKNYRVVKRGLQRYELYVRTTKRGQKDFTLYIDDVTSDTLRDIWDFFENEYRYCQLYPAIYDAIPEARNRVERTLYWIAFRGFGRSFIGARITKRRAIRHSTIFRSKSAPMEHLITSRSTSGTKFIAPI